MATLSPGFYLNIYPSYLCSYNLHKRDTSMKSPFQIENEKHLRERETKGILSKKSKQKLINSINWLVLAAKKKRVYRKATNSHFWFKINFITLTIPPQQFEDVSSKKIKTLINTWLSYHRKFSQLKNYIWKIEAHEDGRLHIHITSDAFLHHKSIRDSWNRILKRNGLLSLHFNKHGNYDPNSTDVHSVRKIKNIAAYIAKYMAKDAGSLIDFKGHIWGQSYSLASIEPPRIKIEKGEYWDTMNTLFKNKIRTAPVEVVDRESGEVFPIATLYFLSVKDWIHKIDGRIKEAFVQCIQKVKDQSPQLTYSV